MPRNIDKSLSDRFYRIADENPHVTVIGEYEKYKKNILVRCNYCDEEYFSRPSSIMNCCIHNKCLVEVNKREFNKKMKNKFPDIKLKSEYCGCRIKIDMECLICGHEFSVRPDNINGCPKCNNENGWSKCNHMIGGLKRRKSNDDFLDEMNEKNGKVIPLEKYDGMENKIRVKCRTCEYIWMTRPHILLQGKGCPECYKRNRSEIHHCKTHEEFLNDLNDNNIKITPLEKYINVKEKIKVQCNKCNHIWRTSPNWLLNGRGCPVCNKKKGESLIMDYLNVSDIEYVFQKKFEKCRNKHKLSFDFFIPSENMLIEYDGRQHFKPIKYFGGQERFLKQIKSDILKTEFARKNNINLLRIPYWEFKNIPKILKENNL